MLGQSLQQQIQAHANQPPEPLLKEGSFYAQLAQHGATLFDDAAFAAFYDATLGRPSVRPTCCVCCCSCNGIADAPIPKPSSAAPTICAGKPSWDCPPACPCAPEAPSKPFETF